MKYRGGISDERKKHIFHPDHARISFAFDRCNALHLPEQGEWETISLSGDDICRFLSRLLLRNWKNSWKPAETGFLCPSAITT